MKSKEIQITCRKSHLFVALCKFNIKIGDQGMNVIIALNLEAECRSKFQFFSLHCINVYFLFWGERKRHLHADVCDSQVSVKWCTLVFHLMIRHKDDWKPFNTARNQTYILIYQIMSKWSSYLTKLTERALTEECVFLGKAGRGCRSWRKSG